MYSLSNLLEDRNTPFARRLRQVVKWQTANFAKFLMNEKINVDLGFRFDSKDLRNNFIYDIIHRLLYDYHERYDMYLELLYDGYVDYRSFPPPVYAYNFLVQSNGFLHPIRGPVLRRTNEQLIDGEYQGIERYIDTWVKIEYELYKNEKEEQERAFKEFDEMIAASKLMKDAPAYEEDYDTWQRNKMRMGKLVTVFLLLLLALLCHSCGLWQLTLLFLGLATWAAYRFRSFVQNVIFGISYAQVKSQETWNWVIGEDDDDEEEFGDMESPPSEFIKEHDD